MSGEQMNCKRCDKPLPEGETVTCPHCGMRQDTYITPRSQKPQQPSVSKKRTYLPTFISLGLIIAVVSIIAVFSNSNNKTRILNDIDAAYASGDTDMLASLYAQLEKFSGVEEELAETKRKIEFLVRGGPPPDMSLTPEEAASLAETGRNYIDISGVELQKAVLLGEANVIINWQNTSPLKITQIKFTVIGSDSDGVSVNVRNSESVRAVLTLNDPIEPGKSLSSPFLNVWDSGLVETVRLVSVFIKYDNGETKNFSEEVLEILFN